MPRAPLARRAALAALALAGAAAIALAAPGDVTLVSPPTTGAAAEAGVPSADGRHVAFTSPAALTAAPTGGLVQLYVRDRTTGTIALASANAAGAAANAAIDAIDVGNPQFAISGDGRFVVFETQATNLTADADAAATTDIFRKDMVTGQVVLISVNSAGVKANGVAGVQGDPDVSGDGNRVVFESGGSTNLFDGDLNNASDVVVRDVAAGTTVLAAQTTAGVKSNGVTDRARISADGRVVIFEAPVATDNLAPNDTGNANDVFARNLAAGTLAPASDPTVTGGAGFASISGDGRYVAFETTQAYDATNDANAGGNDVYRRDLGTGGIVLVSARNGLPAGGAGDGRRPAISADGDRVAFDSNSQTLTAADANNATRDTYVRDITARTTVRTSQAGATQGATDADRAGLSLNGGLALFVFTDGAGADRLVSGDTNTQPDVHARELVPNDLTAPAIALTGPAEGATAANGRIAVGGTVTDPSGIVALTIDGVPAALTATGGFSATVAVTAPADTIVVAARDGAGNATTVSRSVVVPLPTTVPKRPRLVSVGLKLTATRRARVTVRLSRAARVRATLLRRVVLPKTKRVVLRRAAKTVTRSLKAGRRAFTIPSRPLKAGRYVVRVRILGTTIAGPRTKTARLRVTPPPARSSKTLR